MKKHIVFLNRAYNDTDTHLSLAHEFASDENFRVTMLGYECDGYIGHPEQHEVAPYLQQRHNIHFQTILDSHLAPIHLRLLKKAETFFFKHKIAAFASPSNFLIQYLTKGFHLCFLHTLKKLLSFPQQWSEKVLENLEPDCIVCDEALLQPRRSYFLDNVIRKKERAGFPVFVIQTGHYVYTRANPSNTKAPNYEKTSALNFLPSQWCLKIYKEAFHDEKCKVGGNLRMSPSWIEKLHNEALVQPYFDKDQCLKKLPDAKIKIVLMLSKLNYSIDIDALKQTISALGQMENVAFVIKPHTRGMKFDLMSDEELGKAVIVQEIPSAVLIEWSDLQIFTGSSIIFHAIALDKKVGLLNYCKTIGTIFDGGEICETFDSFSKLRLYLENWRQNGYPKTTKNREKQIENFMLQNVYANLKDKKTAANHKAEMLQNADLLNK